MIHEEPTEPNPFGFFFKLLSEGMKALGEVLEMLAEISKDTWDKKLEEYKLQQLEMKEELDNDL